MTQRDIADALDVSQPAMSQQLRNAPDLATVDPRTLIEAAGPVLKDEVADQGFSRLAVFGSVSRGTARPEAG